LEALKVEFETIDVLESSEIREGIKLYSDWLTIPQLYINKEFIGGSDIMLELYRNGELQRLLGKR
jgi:monothiol glutaredoxin